MTESRRHIEHSRRNVTNVTHVTTPVFPMGCAVTFRGAVTFPMSLGDVSNVTGLRNVITQVLENIEKVTFMTFVTFIPVTSMCRGEGRDR